MTTNDLFRGKLVRLSAEDPDKVLEYLTKWDRDSEYWRLAMDEPAMWWSKQETREYIEKELMDEGTDQFFFMIRSLEDDRVIGEIGLEEVLWNHGDAWVGISIGEKDYWGKGYGTDAMRVLLRFAFTELNLHRVSLTVFEYNPRAIRSYEKAGFVHEGREREASFRSGQRLDILLMGILREEWERLSDK
jgi:RimJ/RimL family protein N-acetyltransferase